MYAGSGLHRNEGAETNWRANRAAEATDAGRDLGGEIYPARKSRTRSPATTLKHPGLEQPFVFQGSTISQLLSGKRTPATTNKNTQVGPEFRPLRGDQVAVPRLNQNFSDKILYHVPYPVARRLAH